MATASTTDCAIELKDAVLRVEAGPGLSDQVQECYRAFANECVTRQCTRALVAGTAKIDAFAHLALRDALRAMALAGLAAGFRLAVVARTANLIAVYDTAVVEAGRLGMLARRFVSEEEAVRWLAAS